MRCFVWAAVLLGVAAFHAKTAASGPERIALKATKFDFASSKLICLRTSPYSFSSDVIIP